MKRLSIFSARRALGIERVLPVVVPTGGEDGGEADEEAGPAEAPPDLRIPHALFPVRTGAGS